MSAQKPIIEKRKSHAFGKDIYLLGTMKDGKHFWLESAKWDCGWYWGFGYIKTYTNDAHPDRAKDIDSHSHFNGLTGKREYYDTEKGCFRLRSDYMRILNDNPDIASVTLSENEQWKLAELMSSFYTLKDAAELFGRGGSHLTTNPIAETLKSEDITRCINETMLPALFDAVYKLLSPAKQHQPE